MTVMVVLAVAAFLAGIIHRAATLPIPLELPRMVSSLPIEPPRPVPLEPPLMVSSSPIELPPIEPPRPLSLPDIADLLVLSWEITGLR